MIESWKIYIPIMLLFLFACGEATDKKSYRTAGQFGNALESEGSGDNPAAQISTKPPGSSEKPGDIRIQKLDKTEEQIEQERLLKEMGVDTAVVFQFLTKAPLECCVLKGFLLSSPHCREFSPESCHEVNSEIQ